MTADRLTLFYWFLIPFAVLFIGVFQKQGRPYYPSALLKGFALMTPPAFYLGVAAYFAFNVELTRDFIREYRVALLVYFIQTVFLIWSLFIVVRVNRAKPGSRVDWFGRERLPDTAELEDAAAMLKRGDTHGLLTPMTEKWLREDIFIRRAVEMAYARNMQHDGTARPGFRLRLIISLLWQWLDKKVKGMR